ncbi:hypothetical protein WJX73_000392 [Symbiochloris irregularis]|uniref:Uncharacterized protein n=1 Tax=Symbiochloris irregularis TaxID=706552 RepID=A0AAW1PRH1_9CHLO
MLELILRTAKRGEPSQTLDGEFKAKLHLLGLQRRRQNLLSVNHYADGAGELCALEQHRADGTLTPQVAQSGTLRGADEIVPFFTSVVRVNRMVDKWCSKLVHEDMAFSAFLNQLQIDLGDMFTFLQADASHFDALKAVASMYAQVQASKQWIDWDPFVILDLKSLILNLLKRHWAELQAHHEPTRSMHASFGAHNDLASDWSRKFELLDSYVETSNQYGLQWEATPRLSHDLFVPLTAAACGIQRTLLSLQVDCQPELTVTDPHTVTIRCHDIRMDSQAHLGEQRLKEQYLFFSWLLQTLHPETHCRFEGTMWTSSFRPPKEHYMPDWWHID